MSVKELSHVLEVNYRSVGKGIRSLLSDGYIRVAGTRTNLYKKYSIFKYAKRRRRT